MPTWFITGASRGIGLELTKQTAANANNTVFASCRSPSSATALNNIATSNKNVHVLPLDVEDEASVRSAVDSVKKLLPSGVGIDYLINNAGFAANDHLKTTEPEALEAHFKTLNPRRPPAIFKTHVSGSFRVFRAFVPLVQASERKVVVTVSSELGSMAHVEDHSKLGEWFPSYAIAKAATNMLSKKIAVTYPDIISFAFAPGWIKTDLGGPTATYEAPDAVTRHIKVYEGATKEISGKFINQFGQEVPW
ncbi:NAD(P)-binding protein [Exidia glandulosa HHB12029]|uniref:NAD(P)-binding protein n=1 Tax=Exidia glandulosa HHB12029 TaxID=1314781 RepID=A0A165HM38_EXIGL|nr:NAD(P)-binding protein [Exidia glandulosa HHB12029]